MPLIPASERLSRLELRRLGLKSDAPLYEYKIYTTDHDEVVTVADLVPKEELLRWRAWLDQKKEKSRTGRALAHALGKDMRAALALSEVAPQDTVVSLLIDNSGSLRGSPILNVALMVDMLAAKLEVFGIKTEILGHTTCEFKGGKSRQDWLLKDCSPSNPGRLNDLRHIVYKDVNASWRSTKENLGLMMCDRLLKENINGEALQWAKSRLLKIPAQRRILIYIGDMLSHDDSTWEANQNFCPDYNKVLDVHFKSAAKEIITAGGIELRGIALSDKTTDVTKTFPACELIGEDGYKGLAGRPTAEVSRRLAALFAPI